MPREWQEIRNELYSRSIKNGLELARARRDLFQAVVERLTRFDIVIRANVRLVDQDANGKRWLRFAASAGPGWTPEILERVFLIDGPSLGSKMIRDASTASYYPDVKNCKEYEPLFKDANSLILVSVKTRGKIEALIAAESVELEVHESVREEIRRVAHECEQSLEHFALIEDRWMFDLLESLARLDSLREVCDAAVNEVQRIYGAEIVSLFLTDETATRIIIAASTDSDVAASATFYSLDEEDGITGWIAATRKALRLRDYRDESELKAIDRRLHWKNKSGYQPLRAKGTRIFMGVPLTQAGKLIGVLRMANKQERSPFSLDDEQLLSRTAEALAIKVQNLRLIERQSSHIAEIEKQVKLSFEMAAAETLDSVGRALVTHLPGLTGAQHVIVRAMDDDHGLRRIAATLDGLPRTIVLGSLLVGKAAQANTPRYFSDISNEGEWDLARQLVDDPNVLRDVRRAALLPCALTRRVVGTLSLFWKQSADFTEAEKRTLEDLAARAGIAIEKCLLREELDRRLEQRDRVLDEIHTVGAAFLARRDLRSLYKQILESAARILGVTYGTLRSISEDQKLLNGEAAHGIGDSIIRDQPLPSTALPQVQTALTLGQPQLISDTTLSLEYGALMRGLEGFVQLEYRQMLQRTKSILAVPIVLRGRKLAVIFLDSEKAINLTPAISKYLEILSGYAAVAIENAKLHEDRENRLLLQEPLSLMGGLLNGYLHFVRNPLQGITSRLNVIEHPAFPPARLPGHVKGLRSDVARLERITHDMRLLAQSHTVKNFAPIELRALIDDVVVDFKADHEWIDWQTPSNPEIPVTVGGNDVQLRIALSMLILNAVDAMQDRKPGARLTILAIARLEECDLIVSDTGCGMDQQTVAKATDNFFTTKPDGTGLGLAIVAGVVKRHNGRIEIQSKPGAGTSVRIVLPRFK